MPAHCTSTVPSPASAKAARMVFLIRITAFRLGKNIKAIKLLYIYIYIATMFTYPDIINTSMP